MPIIRWRHYADPDVAPIWRSWPGAITAIMKWRLYADPGMAPLRRSLTFGQQLDTYAQKSLNLQVWNEQLSPTRRYAIIQVLGDGTIGKVKVVNGQELTLLDTTGTITTKYQARLELRDVPLELISRFDTDSMRPHVREKLVFDSRSSPIAEPSSGELLSVSAIFKKLSVLVGSSFKDPGIDQERNRGAELHRKVCLRLGYQTYEDSGQFPDVRHQLLEVKLQTSATIDLGLVLPNSDELIDIRRIGTYHPKHRDTRYAIFYGRTNGEMVELTHLFLTTGADFFTRFKRFEGKITNGKIQIRLPSDFFDR